MHIQIPLTSKEKGYVAEFCREELSLLYTNLPKCKKNKSLYNIKYTTSSNQKLNLQEDNSRKIYYDLNNQQVENTSLGKFNDSDITKVKFIHSSPPTSLRYLFPDFTKSSEVYGYTVKFLDKIFTYLVAQKEEFDNKFRIKLSSFYKQIFHVISLHRTNLVLKLNDLLTHSGFRVKDVNSNISIFAENKFKDVYSFRL